MTVTLDLPPHVEKACLAEARAKGVPLDGLTREVLIAGGRLSPPLTPYSSKG